MGCHPNGPSMVKIDKNDATLVKLIDNAEFLEANDGQTIQVKKLFELNAAKFLGKAYLDKFVA